MYLVVFGQISGQTLFLQDYRFCHGKVFRVLQLFLCS